MISRKTNTTSFSMNLAPFKCKPSSDSLKIRAKQQINLDTWRKIVVSKLGMSTMFPWGRNPSGLPSVKVRDGRDTFTPVPLSPVQTQCCPKLLWDDSCLLLIAVNPSDLPQYVNVEGNFRCHCCRCTMPLTSVRWYPLSQILLTTKVTILHRANTEVYIPPDTPTLAPIVAAPYYGHPTLQVFV